MSEYEVTGIVETKNRKGNGIKVNGEWYNSFNPLACDFKDEVSFRVKEKPDGKGGAYRNIAGDVKVLSGTVVGGGGGSPSGSGGTAPVRIGFPVAPTDRERSIIRRHAFSSATELFKSKISDGVEVSVSDVVEKAREIENYTSGDEVAHLVSEES